MALNRQFGRSLLASVCLICIFRSAHIHAHPLDHWAWRHPRPQGNELRGIVQHGGQLVAAGRGGMLMVSSNGSDWTVCASPTDADFFSITAGGGRVVAVGAQGAIVSSHDGGQTWTQHVSGVSSSFFWDVAYGKGVFVAVSLDGRIVASTNGMDWSIRRGETNDALRTVIYGDGKFVAPGIDQDFHNLLLTSPDGMTWSETSPPQATGTSILAIYGLAYGNGLFVGVAHSGRVITSSNGLDWVLSNAGTWQSLENVSFVNNRFVAVGASSLLTSPNGTDWTPATYPTAFSELYDVAYDGTHYVAVGTYAQIWRSEDAFVWADQLQAVGSRAPYRFSGVAYGNDTYVVAGDQVLLSSTDGRSFTNHPQPDPAPSLISVTYGIGLFAAIGFGADFFLVSSNGTSWTRHNTPYFTPLYNIGSAQGLLMAVGEGSGADAGHGIAMVSTNGSNWAYRVISTYPMRSFTWGKGLFVAAGGTSVASVATSADAVNWTTRPLDSFPGYVQSIAFGNGVFVAALSRIITSPDAVNWSTTLIPPDFTRTIQRVAFGGGTFLALTAYGDMWRSTDGTNWTACLSPTSMNLNGAAYANGTFMVVGDNVSVLQSGPLSLPANLLSVAAGFPTAQLRLQGEVGRSYLLQSLDQLQPGAAWSNVLTIQPTSAVQTVHDPRPAAPKRFYRAALVD